MFPNNSIKLYNNQAIISHLKVQYSRLQSAHRGFFLININPYPLCGFLCTPLIIMVHLLLLIQEESLCVPFTETDMLKFAGVRSLPPVMTSVLYCTITY